MGELKGQLFAVLAVVVAFSAIAVVAKNFLKETTTEISGRTAKLEDAFEVTTSTGIQIIYLEY